MTRPVWSWFQFPAKIHDLGSKRGTRGTSIRRSFLPYLISFKCVDIFDVRVQYVAGNWTGYRFQTLYSGTVYTREVWDMHGMTHLKDQASLCRSALDIPYARHIPYERHYSHTRNSERWNQSLALLPIMQKEQACVAEMLQREGIKTLCTSRFLEWPAGAAMETNLSAREYVPQDCLELAGSLAICRLYTSVSACVKRGQKGITLFALMTRIGRGLLLYSVVRTFGAVRGICHWTKLCPFLFLKKNFVL